jgi:5'-3' exoribonuclease 2
VLALSSHLLLIFSSGGMNGYLWLSERNVWRSVVPSPINGLPTLEYNQVL